MSRTGRSFTVIDNAGELAINSKPAMTLAEIEHWIGEHIKVARKFPDLTSAELSVALQEATAAAEKQAAGRH